MIAVAAGVIVLGGAFAAAYFSGALDGVFGNNTTTVASAKNDEEETTTKKSSGGATTTTEEQSNETTEVSETTEKTTSAVTTAKTTAATTTKPEEITSTESIFVRRQSPAMATLFRELNIETHTSSDKTSKGAVEETVVNFTNAVFGSARNVSSEESRYGDVFGMQCDVSMDFTDAFSQQIVSLLFAESGAEQQFTDIVRIIGASEFDINLEIGGEITDGSLSPEMTLSADWNIRARNFISALCYMDLEEILLSAPGITNKLFYTESTMVPIDMGDLEGVGSQLSAVEGIGDDINALMPYIEKMLIAAIGEIEVSEGGKEDLSLARRKVTLDTIDVAVTDKTAARAAIAALNVLKKNADSYDLIVNAYNKIFASSDEMPTIDVSMLGMVIDSAIAQMQEMEESSYEDMVYRVRLYMNDGMLAGIVLSNPEEADVYGYVSVTDAGYAFWYNDLMYGEYDEIADVPPSYNITKYGDWFEVYGDISSAANGGVSGDLRVNIREYDEVFNEKLISFSDLNMKAMFGMPMPTGKFTVNMKELFEVFDGKDSSLINFVYETALTLKSLEEVPFLKNLIIDLTLDASDKEYSILLAAKEQEWNSSISFLLKFYFTNKAITRPTGDRLDISNADQNELMQLMEELNGSIDKKFEELSGMGYEVTWVKTMITSMLSGQSDGGMETYDTYTGVSMSDSSAADFIFANSSDEMIDPQTLISMDPEALKIARNEIYARHGWVFNDVDLQLYFNQQWWYVPLYNNESITLNDIETMNIELITQVEEYFGYGV